jgi:hypothetical protein
VEELSDKYPRLIVARMLEEIRAEPERRYEVISKYLPLLVDYIATEVKTSRVLFARFKLALTRNWEAMFPDIPVYELEGVYDFETMVKRIEAHLHSYSDRLIGRVAATRGVYSSSELANVMRLQIAELIFRAVLDVLSFRGEI